MPQISNNRIAASALASYVHPPAGNTERYLTLEPFSAAGPTLSSYQALKDYAIRDFGSGFPAAEAILTHIVRNKLGNQSQMPRDFWNRLVVLPVRCTLRSAQTGQTFEASTANSVAGISGEFAASEGPLRVQEVEDYAIQMREGAELGVPLYATGAVLNLLGGNAQPRSMYMMDGARRITAAALNRRREVTIWLLLVEDEYARLLDPAEVGGLRHRLSSLRWFSNYQSIPLAGLQGERSLNRFGLMEMSLLRDQVVMDFGCNTGQSCLKAVQAGAREAIGIEGMRDTWEGAVQIGELTGFQNLRYLNVDFNAPDFDALINQQSPERADYSFFFSVYRTRELVQRDRLFQYIIDKTRKGIFFEGHAHPKIDTLEYYDWLFDSFGLSHQFLGNSEGELRPLFFLDLAKAKRTASTPSTGQAAFPPVPKFSEALPPQMPVPPVPSLLSRSVPPWQARQGLLPIRRNQSLFCLRKLTAIASRQSFPPTRTNDSLRVGSKTCWLRRSATNSKSSSWTVVHLRTKERLFVAIKSSTPIFTISEPNSEKTFTRPGIAVFGQLRANLSPTRILTTVCALTHWKCWHESWIRILRSRSSMPTSGLPVLKTRNLATTSARVIA